MLQERTSVHRHGQVDKVLIYSWNFVDGKKVIAHEKSPLSVRIFHQVYNSFMVENASYLLNIQNKDI